jgi:hypothetical protein
MVGKEYLGMNVDKRGYIHTLPNGRASAGCEAAYERSGRVQCFSFCQMECGVVAATFWRGSRMAVTLPFQNI